jgi:hypothetical protein
MNSFDIRVLSQFARRLRGPGSGHPRIADQGFAASDERRRAAWKRGMGMSASQSDQAGGKSGGPHL